VAKRQSTRQRIRKALIIFSFLLFPITINYFSPYVIIDGASQGIINGSFISFALMFLSALFVGRLWCGWGCPAGGLQEICFAINDRPARGGRFNWIKWAIWIPWLSIIAMLAIRAGGYRAVNVFHLTDSGISVDRPESGMPLYLLDGAVHDPGPQDPEPVPLAIAAPEGKHGRLHRLQTLYGHLPDEPGRAWDGAEKRHGEQRVHPVRELRRRVPAGRDPLFLQRREIERPVNERFHDHHRGRHRQPGD
jgi:hypothetical protein